MKSGNTNFHPLWAIVEESDVVLVVICWHSGCDGISLLPDYWTEILEKLLQKSTLYEMWYFRLTIQENAGDCFGGLEDLQFSTWQGADLLPANSGKSFILTSNGRKSDFTGFDLPAEFGDDRAPRNPVVQIHKVNKHKKPHWAVQKCFSSAPPRHQVIRTFNYYLFSVRLGSVSP